MPPPTPSTTKGCPEDGPSVGGWGCAPMQAARGVRRVAGSGGGGRWLGELLGGEQAGVDLAKRDRQRLLLRVGRLDQGAHVLQQTLTELAVVRVDLTCPLGREDDQLVLRV